MSTADLLSALPLYFLNGLLVSLYWLAAHFSEGLALMCGLVIAFAIDPGLQARASQRPRRYERGGVQTAFPTASAFTLLVLAAWLGASLCSYFPVPVLGAAMWLLGLVSILAVSEERFNQAWWLKTGVLVYTVLVLLLRFGLQALQQASPAEWSGVVGSSADAQLVLSHTRSNMAMIGMLFVFVLYPLGFAAGLFNRFLRNPKPLYNIWLESSAVLRRIRTRTH